MVFQAFYPTVAYSEWGKYTQKLERCMVVASSCAGSVLNQHTSLHTIPVPPIPETVVDRAADWGGYRVMNDWNGKAPYTIEHYMQWLHGVHPRWAATWDYPCGGKKSLSSDEVRAQQDETTLMAWTFWHRYRDVPWCWVPTIQGRTVEDYQRHAEDLSPLIRRMKVHYHARTDTAFRVGIGSLVGRKPKAIKAIVDGVAAHLPSALGYHAWGVKLSVLASPFGFESIMSCDSGAFNGRFGEGLEEFKRREEPQRQIVFEEKLPAYQASITRTVSQEKQYHTLFEGDQEAS